MYVFAQAVYADVCQSYARFPRALPSLIVKFSPKDYQDLGNVLDACLANPSFVLLGAMRMLITMGFLAIGTRLYLEGGLSFVVQTVFYGMSSSPDRNLSHTRNSHGQCYLLSLKSSRLLPFRDPFCTLRLLSFSATYLRTGVFCIQNPLTLLCLHIKKLQALSWENLVLCCE